MKEDPFSEEYKRWNSGSNAEKYVDIRSFPEAVEIELTNSCNLACKFCPTGVRNLNKAKGIVNSGRQVGFMGEFTYLKIIGEIKDHDCHIRFARFGEPTLHPHFWRFVKMAKDLGIKISLITNGTKLRELKHDIDSVKVSIHSLSNGVFKGVMALETMNTFRHISITSDELNAFGSDLNFDNLNVDKVSKYATFTKDKNFKKRLPCCSEAFNKLSVNWNGDIALCCNCNSGEMVVGSLCNNTLKEVWFSEEADKIRKVIVSGKHFKKFECCSQCYDLGVY